MSLLFLLLMAAAQPTGAAAKQDPGIVHKFTECLAKASPAGARDLLVADYSAPDYPGRFAALVKQHDRCLKKGRSVNSDTLVLAGALAEAVLEGQFQPDVPADRLARNAQRASLPPRSLVEAAALCTVMFAPKETSRLFTTDPGSASETRAIGALAPAMGGCVKANLRLNREAVRSVLALAAWRIVSMPRSARQ